MGLKFLERDERILYISEALETYKGITGTADATELPCLYKKGKHPAVLVIDEQYAFTSPDSVAGTKGLNEEARQLLNGMVENTKSLLTLSPVITLATGMKSRRIVCHIPKRIFSPV